MNWTQSLDFPLVMSQEKGFLVNFKSYTDLCYMTSVLNINTPLEN